MTWYLIQCIRRRLHVRHCFLTWNDKLKPVLGTSINPFDNIVFNTSSSKESNEKQLGVIQSIELIEPNSPLQINVLPFCLSAVTDAKMKRCKRQLYVLDDSKSITIQSNQIINIARMFEYNIGNQKYYVAHPLGATTRPLLYHGLLTKKTNARVKPKM